MAGVLIRKGKVWTRTQKGEGHVMMKADWSDAAAS